MILTFAGAFTGSTLGIQAAAITFVVFRIGGPLDHSIRKMLQSARWALADCEHIRGSYFLHNCPRINAVQRKREQPARFDGNVNASNPLRRKFYRLAAAPSKMFRVHHVTNVHNYHMIVNTYDLRCRVNWSPNRLSLPREAVEQNHAHLRLSIRISSDAAR